MTSHATDRSDEEVLATFVDQSLPPSRRETAFHTLVDRYHRRVFAVCLHVLGSPSEAEDATQETFVKLARGADTFRGDAKLSTWLYRVARNVCTDHVRYEARRPSTPVADIADLHEAPSEADSTSGTDTAMSVHAALAELDEEHRRVLLLVGVEGLSYAEAAEATGTAVGTVKSRVSRARVRLAELLTDGDDTEPSPQGRTGGFEDGAEPGATQRPRGPPGR
ncbi:MAG: RNA polymerase sigma factor [Nitriliruptoraceae bacterium]